MGECGDKYNECRGQLVGKVNRAMKIYKTEDESGNDIWVFEMVINDTMTIKKILTSEDEVREVINRLNQLLMG